MGGKESLGLRAGVVVEILHHTPRNGDAVVGTRTPANLVQQHKAAVGDIVENGGTFEHLDHKGTLALRDVVAGTHAGENLIDNADVGTLGGDKRANLSHQHNKSRLSHIG